MRQALQALTAALAETQRPTMIIGGIAVIARGVPRLTRDVDATILGPGTEVRKLVSLFERHDIVPRIPDAIAFAKRNQVLLLRHAPSGVDVDLSFAWTGFELEALSAAERVRLAGTEVMLPRVEDLILYKLVAWRPQDRQDVERLLALHALDIDLARVRRVAADLDEALETGELTHELERLIARTRRR